MSNQKTTFDVTIYINQSECKVDDVIFLTSLLLMHSGIVIDST